MRDIPRKKFVFGLTALLALVAAFYLIGAIVERGRNALLLRRVQQAADPAAGRALVADTLPPPVAAALAPQELERVRELIAGLPAPPPHVELSRADALGALGVFLLVFLSTFPVVVPFFFGADLDRALRISNGVAIVLIFGATYRLALSSGLRPFRTALAMVGLGGVLVAIAIALGR